ncbi:hypothetical protein [Actinopolyspora saharensis]|uniref:hypothetical protein n=1 Tax=Actinopolyspora saharensis TaxID=995062 RepID=UPI003F67B036
MVSDAVSLEDRLANAGRAGELLDLSEETDREIPATAIRHLLFGSDAENIDPRGVRLQGAHITGQLDLTDVRAVIPLTLHQCEFDEGIKASRAHIPHLDLSGSRFPHLDADDLVCEHDLRLSGVRCEWLSVVGATITGDLLLNGGFTASSDSEGGTLRLAGANITGQLSLSGAELTANSGPAFHLHGAHITGQLILSGAELTASNGPALDAERITADNGMFLNEGFTASSDSQLGTLLLLGSSITGQLILREAQLIAIHGPALVADNLTVSDGLFLDEGFSARSDSEDGTLRLLGAHITGQLNLSGAELTASNGPALHLPGSSVIGQLILRGAQLTASNGSALHADGITVSSGVFLDQGFIASSDSDNSTLRLSRVSITGQLILSGAELTASNGPALHLQRAQITGQLILHGTQLTASNGPALHADRITIGESLFLDEGFSARSDSEDGTLRLLGAQITGQLILSGAELTASNGPALHANRITVGDSALLDEGFSARSDSEDGTLRLLGAHITGQLNLSGAELIADSGPALYLPGTTVTGQISLSGAELTASNGPALHAESLTTSNDLFLDEEFIARSDSQLGTLRLVGAHITGQISLSGAELTASNGPALDAERITIGNNAFLDEEFTASSSSSDGTVRLNGANISGDLFVKLESVGNTGQSRLMLDLQSAQVSGNVVLSLQKSLAESGQEWRVDVDGLRYPFIPRAGTYHHWLRLLREHTVKYAAQPYQQLASVYRSAGHDREAREILIAQQRDLRRRGDLGGWFRRLLHRLSGAFIGYGHRPFRALDYLAVLCAVTVGLVLLAGALGLAVRAHPNTGPCSMAESIGLGIDTAVPLLKTGGGQRCEIATTTGWGQAFYLGKYLLTIFGWAFATLFVAGYTGLVRQNT